jgi:hypothetical protein
MGGRALAWVRRPGVCSRACVPVDCRLPPRHTLSLGDASFLFSANTHRNRPQLWWLAVLNREQSQNAGYTCFKHTVGLTCDRQWRAGDKCWKQSRTPFPRSNLILVWTTCATWRMLQVRSDGFRARIVASSKHCLIYSHGVSSAWTDN